MFRGPIVWKLAFDWTLFSLEMQGSKPLELKQKISPRARKLWHTRGDTLRTQVLRLKY